MATKADDNMHDPAVKPAAAPKPVSAPKPTPATSEQLEKSLEALVAKAEATGQRDDPAVANARALLDSKKSGTETK